MTIKKPYKGSFSLEVKGEGEFPVKECEVNYQFQFIDSQLGRMSA